MGEGVGKLKRSYSLLEKSLDQFDPFWEKEAIADSLVEMARLLKQNNPRRREILNRLFRLNPGALLQNGFGLPIIVQFELDYGNRRAVEILKRMLEQSGFELAPQVRFSTAGAAGEGFRYKLFVSVKQTPGFRLVELPPKGGSRATDSSIQAEPKLVAKGTLEPAMKDVRLKALCYQLVELVLKEVYRVSPNL